MQSILDYLHESNTITGVPPCKREAGVSTFREDEMTKAKVKITCWTMSQEMWAASRS